MPGATIERTVSESVDLAPLEARVAILEKYSVQITGTLTELESRIVDLEEKLAEKD
jgi:prefoldin subunit 5